MESNKIQTNIKDQVFSYLGYWKWFFLSIIISLIIANFYLRYTADIFYTEAKIEILDTNDAGFKLPNEGISIFGVKNINLENQIEIIKSSRITEQVVDKLDLTTEVFIEGNIKKTELWKNRPFQVIWAVQKDSLANLSTSFYITISEKGYTLNDNNKEYLFGQTNFDFKIPFKLDLIINKKNQIGTKYIINLKKKKQYTKSISNNIIIDYVGNQSEILKISYKGNNIDKINDIVNTLIDVFKNDGILDRQLIFKKTIEFVDERFETLYKELDNIETSKANYEKNNELSYVEADAGLLMGNLNMSRTNFVDSSTQLLLSKMMINTINKTVVNEFLPANIGLENVEINQLIASYNEQLLKLNKLIESGAGESNPTIKDSKLIVSKLKNNIKISLQGYQNLLESKRNELGKINNFEKTRYSKVPLNEKFIRSIERQQTIKESLYVLLLQKREEAAINLAITNPSIKIVEYADNESDPIYPDKKSVYLIALIIGIVLVIVIIFAMDQLDNKIHSSEDLSALLPETSIIAEIPFIEEDNKIINFFDRSPLSESFRILRTNIYYLLQSAKAGKVLMVTSTIKGEGKTFISLNLAISLSTLDKKVVLIGGDLRNPQLHKSLGIDKSSFVGLANYLSDDEITTDNIIIKNYDNKFKFDIIMSGAIPPNPAELLSNGKFENLLNELKKEYDFVIVDTAPTLLVTDTAIISNMADTVLYVTRANFTEKKLVKFMSKIKEAQSIKSMGIILNNVGEKEGYGYGYKYKYKYSYNYGYEYGYGANTKVKLKTNLFSKIKKWYKKW
jgi:capsular exopolysaccharide synthesis family protein